MKEGNMFSLFTSILKEYYLMWFVQHMFLNRMYVSRDLIRIFYYSTCNKTSKNKKTIMLVCFYSVHQSVAATVLGNYSIV